MKKFFALFFSYFLICIGCVVGDEGGDLKGEDVVISGEGEKKLYGGIIEEVEFGSVLEKGVNGSEQKGEGGRQKSEDWDEFEKRREEIERSWREFEKRSEEVFGKRKEQDTRGILGVGSLMVHFFSREGELRRELVLIERGWKGFSVEEGRDSLRMLEELEQMNDVIRGIWISLEEEEDARRTFAQKFSLQSMREKLHTLLNSLGEGKFSGILRREGVWMTEERCKDVYGERGSRFFCK